MWQGGTLREIPCSLFRCVERAFELFAYCQSFWHKQGSRALPVADKPADCGKVNARRVMFLIRLRLTKAVALSEEELHPKGFYNSPFQGDGMRTLVCNCWVTNWTSKQKAPCCLLKYFLYVMSGSQTISTIVCTETHAKVYEASKTICFLTCDFCSGSASACVVNEYLKAIVGRGDFELERTRKGGSSEILRWQAILTNGIIPSWSQRLTWGIRCSCRLFSMFVIMEATKRAWWRKCIGQTVTFKKILSLLLSYAEAEIGILRVAKLSRYNESNRALPVTNE